MKRTRLGLLAIIGIAAFVLVSPPASAQITLGSAQSFAALGATTVTNTGVSAINGDVGVSPGTAVTGFPPGLITGGAIHAGDAVAGQAQTDLTAAYNAVAGTACTVDLTGQDLGGLTLTPGVYCFSSSAGLTGILTLNFQNNPNALFLFKIGSTLVTASGSSVVPINSGTAGACPPNLFWQVGSSATLGTGSTFTGNILAQASITLTTAARLNGRALARAGAVTLDTNTVGICAPAIVCTAITVNPDPATLPAPGAVGSLYTATFSATGGTAPHTFSLTSGTLPTGLTLSAAGTLTGTLGAPGTFNFTITAQDANGCLGSRAYSLVIAAPAPCPVITLGPPPVLPPGVIGTAYNQTMSASGGTGPGTYTFSVTGSLPTGLSISPAGAITGSPTTAGLFSFTIQATDGNLCVGSAPYSIAIVAAPGIPTLNWVGMALLIALIAGAGMFLSGRFSA